MATEKFVTKPINLMEMTDKEFLSNEMFADGEERIYTIEGIREEELVNEQNGTHSRKPVVYFVETDLKLALNKTNIKTLTDIYKELRADLLVGKKIQIYKTTVKAFGKNTPCLRIRELAPVLKCSVCGKEIDEDIYRKSVAHYGKPYCSKECLEKETKGEKIL